jgi:hypothetical protein
MAELYLAGRLKLVGDGWILFGQDVVAAKSADATLDGYLSFGIFGLACGARIAILRQEKAAQKQQDDQDVFHGKYLLSEHAMATLLHRLAHNPRSRRRPT